VSWVLKVFKVFKDDKVFRVPKARKAATASRNAALEEKIFNSGSDEDYSVASDEFDKLETSNTESEIQVRKHELSLLHDSQVEVSSSVTQKEVLRSLARLPKLRTSREMNSFTWNPLSAAELS
jgi:hypothetical protein